MAIQHMKTKPRRKRRKSKVPLSCTMAKRNESANKQTNNRALTKHRQLINWLANWKSYFKFRSDQLVKINRYSFSRWRPAQINNKLPINKSIAIGWIWNENRDDSPRIQSLSLLNSSEGIKVTRFECGWSNGNGSIIKFALRVAEWVVMNKWQQIEFSNRVICVVSFLFDVAVFWFVRPHSYFFFSSL